MHRSLVFLASCVAALVLCHTGGAVERGFTDKFCIDPPHDKLCPQLPFDQADFSRDFSYMLIEKGAQDPFDVFAWQAFVALNWPSDRSGNPLQAAIGARPDAPRVWQSFVRRDALFAPDPALYNCGENLHADTVLVGDMEQSDGTVLVDRSGNLVVYSTFANHMVSGFVRKNRLDKASSQSAFTKTRKIAFPQGQLPNPSAGTKGTVPSVTLKMAWRILDAAETGNAPFFTRSGVVYVPAKRSLSGKPLCARVTLGLVGMHIALRTESGNGDEWIWATFEHIDNAPLAANARNVNSIYADDLFPGGCTTPAVAPAQTYSFFNGACIDCKTNTPTLSDWRWAESPPHARRADGGQARSTQAVRCWEVFESTAAVNDLWSGKLKGSVWENYMLISAQWRGAEISPLFEHGEAPRYLTNLTLETYQQTANDGTWLGCHATARTASGVPADFVFMLQRAN